MSYLFLFLFPTLCLFIHLPPVPVDCVFSPAESLSEGVINSLNIPDSLQILDLTRTKTARGTGMGLYFGFPCTLSAVGAMERCKRWCHVFMSNSNSGCVLFRSAWVSTFLDGSPQEAGTGSPSPTSLFSCRRFFLK